MRPYLLDPVTITKYPLAEEFPSSDASPLDGRRFLTDPIHPHLLALNPGDSDSFLAFTTKFGLGELVEWAGDRDLPKLFTVTNHYESGRRHFASTSLASVWVDRRVADAVADEQERLRAAFKEAEVTDARIAARIVLAHGWEHDAFRIDLALDDTDSGLYEMPRHVWSRAWFELLEGVANNRLPKTCGYCGDPFVPTRRNAAYCIGTKCKDRAYEERRAKTPERQEYQRNYKKQQRRNQTSKARIDTKNNGGK